MFHHRRYPLLHSRIGLLILLVLIVIILLFVFGSGSDDDSTNLNDSPSLQEKLDALDQASKTITNEPKSSPVDDTLCEDYLFSEGETKVVSEHTVEVTRIASTGAKLEVDGEADTLFEGDSEILGDDFRVDLIDVAYFGSGDFDNAVTLRLGCENKNEDPNDKYIRDKGEDICEEIYNTCKAEFDLE